MLENFFSFERYKTKSVYFITLLILTLFITRVITYYILDPNIILLGVELHHLYYGIALLIITLIISSFNKNNKLCLTLYAISIALIVDEFEYALRGFGDINEYAATLPSVIVITFLITLTVIIIKYKHEKFCCSIKTSLKI
jgi:hypothetical protein